jgi:hypothetical protein
MATETIYKLQPNRTIHLQGASGNGAMAALTETSETGFTLSGVFRDSADFAVLILWDEDDYFGHPSIRYLPDSDFSGLTLTFDLAVDKLVGIDSAKSPTISWDSLSYVLEDGTRGTIPLLEHATNVGGTYTSASGVFTITSSAPVSGDWVAVWFENLAFQAFMPAGSALQRDVAVFALDGTTTITVGDVTHTYETEAGQSSAEVAAALAALFADDADVIVTSDSNIVTVKPNLNTGDVIAVNGTDLWQAKDPPTVLSQDLADQINATTYDGTYALQATAAEGALTITAVVAADGRASGEDGNMIRMYGQTLNEHLAVDALVQFSGGSSAATWRIAIDFTALGIDTPRQLWLTFAPRLKDSAAYEAEDWTATVTNWSVSDENTVRALQVAGPGSVRVGHADAWARYTGSWALEAGITYWRGFARHSDAIGATVTVTYSCQFEHDLWVGTSLYTDRGKFSARLDEDVATTLDCYLNTSGQAAVSTRRKLRSDVAAGTHTVVLTVAAARAGSTGNHCYFDFLEAAVGSDVPDAPESLDNIAPAIDYDTQHGYQLSPQRLMWMMDRLGFAGPINEYMGVFWWNQRTNTTAVFPTAVVSIGGTYADGDSVFIEIGGFTMGKSVFAPDTNDSIAAHFAYFINETFVGVWAAAVGATLTITNRAPTSAYDFTCSVSKSSAAGTISLTGSLAFADADPGTWTIDPSATPVLNSAARAWHADLFAEVATRGGSIVTSMSLELVNPPDDPDGGHVWASRFPDGAAVTTDTGVGGLFSTQCAPGAADFLAYQEAAYVEVAGLQDDAGLTVELQFGEFLWWFFANDAGMAYYDAETAAAALTALGSALHTFLTPDDDPTDHSADATFLRDRLRDHVASIVAAVLDDYAGAQFELLYPYDVNYPEVYGIHDLGGQLNAFVNLPTEWKTKDGSGLDRVKIEALDFGSGTRSLDLAAEAVQLAAGWGWPADSVRYLFPVFNGGCPLTYERQIAVDQGVAALTPFAFDHVCLMGWDLREQLAPGAQIL